MWPAVLGGGVFLVFAAVYLLVGRSMRVAVRRAFRPVSIRFRRGASLLRLRGRGALHGRTFAVRAAAGLRDPTATLLAIELASGAAFTARFATRTQAPAAPPPDAVEVPGFPDFLVTTDDPRRMLAFAKAAQGELHRVLAPRSPIERRIVLLQKGTVSLTVAGIAWTDLTAAALAGELDELVALATKAERV